MKIDNIEVGNLFLAPMAGVTEVGFRKLAKICGADLTYTEMVNAKALLMKNEATTKLLIKNAEETPSAVQLFGSNAKDLAQACTLTELDDFDIIDFNFGCPAPKIVKNGEGSALLNNLDKIKTILTECKKISPKPITAKFRIGFNDGDNVAVDVAKICQDAGVSAITVHGRTREQMYSGKVDYETIAKVKASVNIPVIGNGDVVDKASYDLMKQTGVDGVMIGRGALGNPWIFSELKGKTVLDKFELIQLHIKTLREHFDERFVCLHMRKHLLWYLRNVPSASKIRAQIAVSDSLEKSLQLIKENIWFIFDNLLKCK